MKRLFVTTDGEFDIDSDEVSVTPHEIEYYGKGLLLNYHDSVSIGSVTYAIAEAAAIADVEVYGVYRFSGDEWVECHGVVGLAAQELREYRLGRTIRDITIGLFPDELREDALSGNRN